MPIERDNSMIAKAIQFVFPKNCFEELLVKFNVVHPECFRLVSSRLLGLGIVLGSVLVKVPQIIKLWSARSGAGISLLSLFLELIGLGATISYSYVNNFHFSAWGDGCFVAVQTAIIAFMVIWFGGRKIFAFVFLILYGSLLVALINFAPLPFLAALQACNIPIVVSARAIQAIENYRNQSTGQLSSITCFLLFAGCLARIFTSVQETGDKLVVLTYIVASIMNGLIFAQILIYWGKKPRGKSL